jgi:hypothetical protein
VRRGLTRLNFDIVLEQYAVAMLKSNTKEHRFYGDATKAAEQRRGEESMPNFHKMPNPHSKRGVIVHGLRALAGSGAIDAASLEAFRDRVHRTDKRFRDEIEVDAYIRWAFRNEWVKQGVSAPTQQTPVVTSGAISIRDAGVGLLARKLAFARGTNVTEAVGFALRAALKEGQNIGHQANIGETSVKE